MSMTRIAIALGIAALIYGVALGAGSLLYASGAIATGATHNDCANFKATLAPQYGGDEEKVPQSAIKALAKECLAGHELSTWEALRSEYLVWSIWPAAVCAVIFLLWPAWARVLHRQEEADLAAEASRLEMGL
jgi:hypothetical protein